MPVNYADVIESRAPGCAMQDTVVTDFPTRHRRPRRTTLPMRPIIQKAIEAYTSGQYATITEAAREHGTDRETLSRNITKALSSEREGQIMLSNQLTLALTECAKDDLETLKILGEKQRELAKTGMTLFEKDDQAKTRALARVKTVKEILIKDLPQSNGDMSFLQLQEDNS